MDFLRELNIDSETIEKIKNNNLPSAIRQFICDRENATKIIKYMQEVGIQIIDDILIRRIEIFSIDYDRIKQAFDEYNINLLVALVNEDISAVNFL